MSLTSSLNVDKLWHITYQVMYQVKPLVGIRKALALRASGCAQIFWLIFLWRSVLSKTKDGELLTLDAIRSGIRFQRSVAEGWIKVSKELVCTPALLLEICVSQNLEKLGGGGGRPIKFQGWNGERIGINCVAWEGQFPHWLYHVWCRWPLLWKKVGQTLSND